MYLIGELADSKAANKIIQLLKAQDITCEEKYHADRKLYSIIVFREEDVPAALECYRVILGLGKPMQIDPEWEKVGRVPLGSLSLSLILISVIVYICRSFIPEAASFVDEFFISKVEGQFFYEVQRGQVWRLLTPAFLHFNFIHILFNMLWLKDLGSLIEYSKGQRFFVFLFIFSGIFSNVAQYLVAGPNFGGMSGVVYACLGFVWMHKKFDDEFDYGLPKRDMIIMIAFFVACMTGIFGPIANTAHALGLSIGMLWGIFSGSSKKMKETISFSILAIFFSIFAVGVEWFKRDGSFYFFLS